MIRTPLYTSVPGTSAAAAVPADSTVDPEPVREATRDDYLTKIIKYVPAEIVAAFAGLSAAAAAVDDWAVVAVFVVGLIATPAFFYLSAHTLPKPDQPKLYFYGLTLVAFVIWSLAISENVRDQIDIDAQLSEFLLVVGAFLIPFLDEMITILLPRLKPS